MSREIKFTLNDNGNLFNPDDIVLSKSQIQEFIVNIRKNAKNQSLKTGCYAIEASILFLPETVVQEIFKEIFNKFNQLVIMNSLEHAKNNNESWAITFEKLMKKENDS